MCGYILTKSNLSEEEPLMALGSQHKGPFFLFFLFSYVSVRSPPLPVSVPVPDIMDTNATEHQTLFEENF